MTAQILTGAGIGIFAGYSYAMCGGISSLLVFCCSILAGYLINLRLKGYPVARFCAALALIAGRIALFFYPVPEAVPAVCGMIAGMAFYFHSGSASAMKSTVWTGILSSAYAFLFVTGSGEAALAFICGGAALLAGFLKRSFSRKLVTAAFFLLLIALFPAGTLSKYERLASICRADDLQRGICGAMILPQKEVAVTALSVGDFAQESANVLSNFPGLKKTDTAKHYITLYPFPGTRQEKYPVVFVNGNGRMCRLASRLVSPGGILIVPDNCISDVPKAFRYWSELPSSPRFIALSRDFAIDSSEESISRKMRLHIKKLGLEKTIPEGVCSAVFSSQNKAAGGIRETKAAKQINYTLWFFGLLSAGYLMLRLIVFSRFDKGERRWSALENTASTVMLLLLLKHFPDNICSALLPVAAFLMLPALKISGKKSRILQLAGATLCLTAVFVPEFLNPAQFTGAVVCGIMWTQLRLEKNAVMTWVDSCSLAGIFLGTAIFMLLLTVSAPPVFILGTVLLLRSNILFRSL